MTYENSALRFTEWLDDRSQFESGLDSSEERLVHILEDARHNSRPASSASIDAAVETRPSAEFASTLLDHLEVLADTGGVFAADSKFGAVMRVREALPIRLPEPGVAYCDANQPDDSGRVQSGRARHPVALLAAAILLIGAIAVPIVQQFVAGISLNRNALVVSAGADAARQTGGSWASIKAGDKIGAGETVKSGKERLVLRLADESLVRMDTSTYGTLSLHSKDPTIEVGDGRVYVEVNSSGAVSVLVDGVVIASHGPGSSYSVDAKGIVTVTEGGAKATTPDGKTTEIPEGARFSTGTTSGDAREPRVPTDRDGSRTDDAEWLEWNRAGGRNPR
ncbi:MAG: hypothetical protein DCC49_11565 [Acidobacteria bacterium]|nr:MAG: hypothetical protein DCC49_11565 [Acidobacteriota bacterium]